MIFGGQIKELNTTLLYIIIVPIILLIIVYMMLYTTPITVPKDTFIIDENKLGQVAILTPHVDTGGPWYCGAPWMSGMQSFPVARYNDQGKLETMLLNPKDKKAWMGCKLVNGKLIVPNYTGYSTLLSQLNHNAHQQGKIRLGVNSKLRDN